MKLNPDTRSSMVTYTTAPVDYDWAGFGNIMLIDHVAECGRGKPIRKILTTTSEYYRDNQRNRYYSGMELVLDQAEFEKQVESGLITLTPTKEVRHYRGEVTIRRGSDYGPFYDLVQEFRDMEGVTLEAIEGGLTQRITVLNDRELFEDIIRRLNGAIAAGQMTPTE